MEFLKMYPVNMTKRDTMKLTEAQSMKKMIDVAGQIIEPTAFVIYQEPDPKTGDVKKVCVLTDGENIYGTVSSTFIKAFEKLYDELGENIGEIRVISGESKNGRSFVSCELV